jgi:hypothetical protein
VSRRDALKLAARSRRSASPWASARPTRSLSGKTEGKSGGKSEGKSGGKSEGKSEGKTEGKSEGKAQGKQ